MVARFAGARLVVVTALALVDAGAANPPMAVQTALSHIKSVTGDSVFERMQSCGITFASGSSAEKATSDYPDMPAHNGDLILDVYINVPRLADQNPEAYKDILARWVVSGGVAHPINGWAQWLQQKPVPIGSMVWMNC